MSEIKRNFTKTVFSTYGRATVYEDWYISHHYGINRLYYIHSGTATFKDDMATHQLTAGNFYFFSSNIPFNISCDTSLDHSFIDFIVLPPIFSEHFITLEPSSCEVLTSAAKVLMTLAEHYPIHQAAVHPVKYRELLEIYLENFLTLLIDFGYLTRSNNSNLDDVLSYIHKNILRSITIEELANIACMEKNYFIKFFKKHMSITPHKYIQKHRMDFASQLLSQNHKISEVSELCGFSEISSFSRAFKNHFGYYPTHIKKIQH